METLFQSLKKRILENKLFVLVVLSYFFIRVINLLTPPLFNDEAIYLDWGFREIHKPGFLYYSLYDGKQPLLMWIFGILESFFSPAFSGRIVSVFAGFLTLIGLFKTSRLLFNKKIAYLSCIFYLVIPIFSFYDRQALMESSIAAVGVWAFYFLIKAIEIKEYKYSIILGIILGLGFFIKSSSFIFFITAFLIFGYEFLNGNKKFDVFKKSLFCFASFVISIFLLILNPQFWSSLGGNSRYVFGISDLLTFPINIWVKNLLINFEISFYYITPLIFLASILGAWMILKRKEKNKHIFLIFIFLNLIFETLTVKNSSQRYLVSFLPFFTILASYFLNFLFSKKEHYRNLVILLCMIVPFLLTFMQILYQPLYINFMGKFTKVNSIDYLQSFSSGYGVNDAINYLKTLSIEKQIIVGVAENTGNPESAILATFARDKNIKAVYLDSNLLEVDISKYDCLKTQMPTYFISRDNQQAGLEKFFENIKTFKNPFGTNSIGVYKIKSECRGKILEISPKDSST